MSKKYDVIVIGGGATGAHAAYPLVKANYNVLMLDGGLRGDNALEESFSGDFEHIRRTRMDQYKLFLGADLSGIPVNDKKAHANAMSSGARRYISEHTKTILPVIGKGIEISQSLAKGGLTEAWGAACDMFTDQELQAIGINDLEMKKSYQEVIDRIGVSGKSNLFNLQPPARVDNNARLIIDRAKSHNHGRFRISNPILALITKPLGKRKALSYEDLEYALNRGDSIYRARFTIEELETSRNFEYRPHSLVEKIWTEKGKTHVSVRTFNEKKSTSRVYSAKYIVMAAGALGTSRILLRSFNFYDLPVPFIIKEHTLIPCLNLSSLGKAGDRKKFSLCQLFIRDSLKSQGLDKSFTQMYSYKSLMLFKLLEYSPLPASEALRALSLFAPSTMIADVRFPSTLNSGTSLSLKKNESGDFLYVNQNNHRQTDNASLRKIKFFLLRLGLIPLKTVQNPLGSTAHYAGGIPFSSHKKGLLSADYSGRLHQNPNIFIADASTWNALPAKPPALTLMANANRIGRKLLVELEKTKFIKQVNLR